MFSIVIPNFDLNNQFLLYQSYGWHRLNETEYIVCCGDRAIRIGQYGDRKLFYCTDEEFYDFWANYIDLSTDYYTLSELAGNEKLLRNARAFNLDPYEIIVGSCFIKFNEKQRKKIMKLITANIGVNKKVSLKPMGSKMMKLFPDCKTLYDNIHKIKIKDCEEEIEFLRKILKALIDETLTIKQLKNKKYDNIVNILSEVTGITLVNQKELDICYNIANELCDSRQSITMSECLIKTIKQSHKNKSEFTKLKSNYSEHLGVLKVYYERKWANG